MDILRCASGVGNRPADHDRIVDTTTLEESRLEESLPCEHSLSCGWILRIDVPENTRTGWNRPAGVEDVTWRLRWQLVLAVDRVETSERARILTRRCVTCDTEDHLLSRIAATLGIRVPDPHRHAEYHRLTDDDLVGELIGVTGSIRYPDHDTHTTATNDPRCCDADHLARVRIQVAISGDHRWRDREACRRNDLEGQSLVEACTAQITIADAEAIDIGAVRLHTLDSRTANQTWTMLCRIDLENVATDVGQTELVLNHDRYRIRSARSGGARCVVETRGTKEQTRVRIDLQPVRC